MSGEYAYDHAQLSDVLQSVVRGNVDADAWSWLTSEVETYRSQGSSGRFNGVFARIPRKTGKSPVKATSGLEERLSALRPGFSVEGWTVDRLTRVWLLMQIDASEPSQYFSQIENLFLAAEMSELVALYSALPILAYPSIWQKRCAEGIRSNIGQVLNAVICRNPYPAEELDELAWNQLVLKAVFTEQPVLEIVGLRERRNPELARSLTDYARERWSAHRQVNPLLWLCVAPYLDDGLLQIVKRLFDSANPAEQHAAGLVCQESDLPAAKTLLEQFPSIKSSIENGQVTWSTVAGLVPVK